MKARTHRTLARLTVIGLTALLLTLIGFDVYPLTAGNDGYLLERQAWLQVARVEFLAKDALILASRPASYHSQAISDFQVTLPQFKQAQEGFVKGDASLGIPSRLPDVDVLLITKAGQDYQFVLSDFSAILARPDSPIDPTVLTSLQAHEYPYALQMAQLASLIEQQQKDGDVRLAAIKIILKIAVIVGLIRYYVFSWRLVLAKMIDQEEEKSPPA